MHAAAASSTSAAINPRPRSVLSSPDRVTAVDVGSATASDVHGRIVDNLPSLCDEMIEPLLCGIVLGLIPVTLMGLFVAAWNQYRRGGSALGG